MKPVLPLLFAVFCLGSSTLLARDPAKINAGQRNTTFAPSGSITPDKRTPEGNATLQDKRFNSPELIERKDAAIADKRAPFAVEETREKEIYDRKDYPKPEVRDRETYARDGEKSRIQPKGDMIKKYDMAAKYQDRIKDAPNSGLQRSPTLEKRTTFDRINRFVFRRNGPGQGADTGVTAAGGGQIAAPAGYTAPAPTPATSSETARPVIPATGDR
jgi:hypothetical protein